MHAFRCLRVYKSDLSATKRLVISCRFTSNENSSDSASPYLEETEEDRERRERVAERPISYLPDHLPQCRERTRIKPWWRYKEFVTINPLPDPPPEWTETAEYPPIFESTPSGLKKEIRMEWYQCIRNLSTAQQKMYEISKHYSHNNFILEPVMKQHNYLPLIQFITRTHLIRECLPSVYDSNVDHILEKVKQPLIDTICSHLFQTKQRKPIYEMKSSFISFFGAHNEQTRLEMAKQEDIIEDVVKIIRKILGKDYEHLKYCQLDSSASVKSHWWVNDFPVPFKKPYWFVDREFHDESFTYRGSHALNMRVNKPLPPILAVDDPICTDSEIAEYKYNLKKLRYFFKRQHFTMMPGFWLDNGNGYDFPFLLCHSRQDLTLRQIINERPYDDKEQVLDAMAILSSFGWLNGIAANLGFTIYDELTYPLVTQVIITDGQYWSFYVYQLNAHSFYSDVDTSLLKNVCWSSGELKLFDAYEDNQLKGINDDVIRQIIRFMTREPHVDQQLNLRPYLSADTRSEDDIKEMTFSLSRKYANQYSSFTAARQRIHVWERVYKYHPEAEPTPHLRQRPKMSFKFPPFFKHH